jgi:hypothetical protein
MKILLFMLLFLALSSAADGQLIRFTTPAMTAFISYDPDRDEDFSPMVFMTFLITAALSCVLIGAGIALFLFILLIMFGVVSMGIISSSVIVAIGRRSISKGFKTLLLLSGAATGSLVGMVFFYVINNLFLHRLSGGMASFIGFISGIGGGMLLGLAVYKLLRWSISRMKQRYGFGQ